MVGMERKNGAYGGIEAREGAERKEKTENVRAWKLRTLSEMQETGYLDSHGGREEYALRY